MDNKQLQKEWEEVSFESIRSPKITTPYPPEIVFTRELLLFAQMVLAKINKSKEAVFYEELYEAIMNQYYERKRWLKI